MNATHAVLASPTIATLGQNMWQALASDMIKEHKAEAALQSFRQIKLNELTIVPLEHLLDSSLRTARRCNLPTGERG